MPPAESKRVRADVSLSSGKVAERKGSDGRSTQRQKTSDSMTLRGARDMIKLAAKLL
ncbi:hypothetical protein GCM10009631_15370 [Corynebacterium glaucum]